MSIDRWTAERVLLAVLATLSIVLFVLLGLPALRGLVYAGTDLDAFHLPLRWFYWNALRAGQSFDWMPGLFSGFYLTGEGQAGTYHPLHWVLYRYFDFQSAFNLEVWLSYPFLFTGMLLLLRGRVMALAHNHRDVGVSATPLPWSAAVFGALVFTFSPVCLLRFVHPNAVAIVAHLPWLLIFLEYGSFADRGMIRQLAWSGLALLTASTLLLGYLQWVWLVGLIEFFWLWLCTRPEVGPGATSHVGRFANFAFAKSLGCLLAAIQIWPSYDQLLHSQRFADPSTVTPYDTLSALDLVQWFAPYLLKARVAESNTHEYGIYLGVVPLMLTIWLFGSDRAKANRFCRAIVFFAIIAFVVVLGEPGGLYALLALLPVVGVFRGSVRYMLLVQFGVALLAALALPRVLKKGEERGQPGQAWLWTIPAAISLFSSVLVWSMLPSDRLGDPVSIMLGPLMFLIGSWALALALRGEVTGRLLLVGLTAADLGLYGFSYAVWPGARSFASIVQEIPPAHGTRASLLQPDAVRGFLGDQWTIGGWRLADGYAALIPESRLKPHSLGTLQLSSVELVRFPAEEAPIDGLLPVGDGWWTVPGTLPRIRLATRAIVGGDPSAEVSQQPADVRTTTVFVDQDVDLGGTPGTVALVKESPGLLEVRVGVASKQMLVVADRFHEGWRASVNGESRPLQRVDGDFIGLIIKPGDTQVRLSFSPDSLRYGRDATLAGLAIWIVLLAIGLWRHTDVVGTREGTTN